MMRDVFRPTLVRLLLCLVLAFVLPLMFFKYINFAMSQYVSAPALMNQKVNMMGFIFIPYVERLGGIAPFFLEPWNVLTPLLVGVYYYIVASLLVSLGEFILQRKEGPPRMLVIVAFSTIIFLVLYYWFLVASANFLPQYALF